MQWLVNKDISRCKVWNPAPDYSGNYIQHYLLVTLFFWGHSVYLCKYKNCTRNNNNNNQALVPKEEKKKNDWLYHIRNARDF